MRLFVAVRPPEEAVEHLDAFFSVRREAARFRWVLPDHWHLTLAFLADVPERALDDLGDRLERAARKRRAFDTALAGGGAFPNPLRSRVVWVGLDLLDDDREELRRLATGARAAASRAGVAVDGQRFRPHLTLARLGSPQETSKWVRLLDGYAGPRWQVDEIALVASYLGEGPGDRPRYDTLGTYPLRRAAAP